MKAASLYAIMGVLLTCVACGDDKDPPPPVYCTLSTGTVLQECSELPSGSTCRAGLTVATQMCADTWKGKCAYKGTGITSYFYTEVAASAAKVLCLPAVGNWAEK